MPLTAGTQLGLYDILSPIGKARMGNNDTRLGRTEAKASSQLNQPHVCAVAGAQDGIDGPRSYDVVPDCAAAREHPSEVVLVEGCWFEKLERLVPSNR